MLKNSACGFGQLALASMLAGDTNASTHLLAPKQTHFPPRFRRIIFLFMWGGPSHVDTFDPKPALRTRDGE